MGAASELDEAIRSWQYPPLQSYHRTVWGPGTKQRKHSRSERNARRIWLGMSKRNFHDFTNTRLSLDGPLEPEGRVMGQARETFVDMNTVAFRSPPIGANLDAESAYPRLGEIAVPMLVMCGDLDIPNTRERSRYLAASVLNGSFHELSGVAHLPSLERPAEVTRLIAAFINRCAGRGG